MTTTEIAPDIDTSATTAIQDVKDHDVDTAVFEPVLPTSAEVVKDFTLLHVDPDELVIGPNGRGFNPDTDLDPDLVDDLGDRGNYVPMITRYDEHGQLVVRDGQIRTHGLRAAKRIAIDNVVSRAVEEAENRAAEENTPFTAEDADRIGTEIREQLAAGDLERPWKMALVLAQEHTITDARAAEIERLIDQHGANFLRFAMTEADHLRFVQGLLDLGVEPEKVGKKLRLKDKDAAVLVTVAQNTTAAGLAQQGVLGLSEGAVLAELLAEFEAYGDETEAVAALTETAQTNPDQLARVAQRLRNARTERLALEAAAAELAEQGVTVIDRPDTLTGPQIRQLADLRYTVRTKPGTALTVKRHAKCPGHAAFLTFHRTWQDKEGKVRIIHVCTDFQKHKHAELRAERGKVFVERSTYSSSGGPKKGPMTEEEKKYRKTVIANGKAWDSATIKRMEALELLAKRRSLSQAEDTWLEAMRASSSRYADAASKGHTLALKLLGWDTKFGGYGNKQSLRAEILKAKPERARVISMVMVLAAVEQAVSRRTTWERPTDEEIAYFAKLPTLNLKVLEGGELKDWEPSEVEALVLDGTEPVDAALVAAVDDEVEVEADLGDSDEDSEDEDSEVDTDTDDAGTVGELPADRATTQAPPVSVSQLDGASIEHDPQVDLAA